MGSPYRAYTIIHRLHAQWDQLALDDTTRTTIQTWAQNDTRLRGARTLTDIQALVAGPVVPETDLVFRALLDKAAERNSDGELAARIVLQLMLGRVVLTSRALAGLIRDVEERSQLAVVAMYDAIHTCPKDKDSYLTPRLAWDAHHTAMRLAQVGAAETPMGDVGEDLTTDDQPQTHPSEELARLLVWSVAEGVLTAEEATLLARRYGQDSPGRGSWTTLGDTDALASAAGVSTPTMRKRCSRSVHRLAKASARYLAVSGD
ncbi:hypothetical protein MRI28_17225 [Nocardiopsis dassonvillei]|uniref:hypothetical protein n=1 Tax=Nocardiopsis dassonvillei TaxID=2014 RepID=UPI00200DDC08|nr:hypothetical protein [Nocardiopsis dassonvillei]MCK9871358.1 hypothetical protein [Nocardiopsis dassonvillei]